MRTHDAFQDSLRLTQLLSPAFPIGAFAHSQGLEAAIADGIVHDAASLESWISTVLRFGSGHMDAVFISLARQMAMEADALTDLYYAYSASSERAQEAAELGRGFQALVSAMGDPAPPLPYAIALGLATRNLCVSTPEVLGLWLQSLSAQLVSVAVRFMPMGQAEGQRVIAALTPTIAQIAAALADATVDDLYSFTPGADMASIRHETQEIRIFRT
ncbi:urease accessory protein UreF [Phaeovulum sp.]|uniref:urease accessory protein UreF n=1 Tax=Phaeovulum sp. TaxID=2934796 RepID=UPI00356570AA